jgi:peptide/nickel transport system substrate-binding protein
MGSAAQFQTLPGYATDVQNRQEARAIMEGLGYGPDKRRRYGLDTEFPEYATLRPHRPIAEIYMMASSTPSTLRSVPQSHPQASTPSVLRSPKLPSTTPTNCSTRTTCGAERNYTGYCNPQLDQMIDRQSMEADEDKRRALVWRSKRNWRKTGAANHLLHPALYLLAAVGEGVHVMVNSLFNGWRMEDVWLDK